MPYRRRRDRGQHVAHALLIKADLTRRTEVHQIRRRAGRRPRPTPPHAPAVVSPGGNASAVVETARRLGLEEGFTAEQPAETPVLDLDLLGKMTKDSIAASGLDEQTLSAGFAVRDTHAVELGGARMSAS